MNLTRGNAFFLFLFFYGVFHAGALLDALFLKIFVEFGDAVDLLGRRIDQLIFQSRFVDIDFAILEVFYFFDALLALLLI